MDLTSWMIVNLISMSHLTYLLNRIVIDGKYKSLLLINAHSSMKDTNFFAQLADLSFGKYTMYNMDAKYGQTGSNSEIKWHRDILQVIALNYGDIEKLGMNKKQTSEKSNRCSYMKKLVRESYESFKMKNVILLIPMPPTEDRKREVWQCLGEMEAILRCIDSAVVFYQPDMSTMANTTQKLIELYVVKPDEYFEIDLGNSVHDYVNLNDELFRSNPEESKLKSNSFMDVKRFHGKTSAQRRNATFIDFGKAGYYLSKYVARDSRMKVAVMQQSSDYTGLDISRRCQLMHDEDEDDDQYVQCNAAVEKCYAGSRSNVLRLVLYI